MFKSISYKQVSASNQLSKVVTLSYLALGISIPFIYSINRKQYYDQSPQRGNITFRSFIRI
ncbi:Hypothetical protein PP7435_CHR4-1983 [Komagataella phaffii CBS 7435]|uniref:Uncharacterized protein n=1 Tax=Komagataella phaffii (strain ATCC 76273 / CBS 7435 / CECT 11047 / NRRL Y-11430 / Wegner 21-1) TaxID=981350 RepID=A0A1G4KR03_KOMPC|nr:Hypothetical protein BQ9382_C4-5022 [Komagataella phaffii CBS 7435]SCV12432.1 Hypothetical protein PP7435_CHR4-1983 [Komagataella phaffii CBS 7435]